MSDFIGIIEVGNIDVFEKFGRLEIYFNREKREEKMGSILGVGVYFRVIGVFDFEFLGKGNKIIVIFKFFF